MCGKKTEGGFVRGYFLLKRGMGICPGKYDPWKQVHEHLHVLRASGDLSNLASILEPITENLICLIMPIINNLEQHSQYYYGPIFQKLKITCGEIT